MSTPRPDPKAPPPPPKPQPQPPSGDWPNMPRLQCEMRLEALSQQAAAPWFPPTPYRVLEWMRSAADPTVAVRQAVVLALKSSDVRAAACRLLVHEEAQGPGRLPMFVPPFPLETTPRQGREA